MAWIALDRAVKAVERFALEGLERWRWLGGEIHAELRQESRRGQGHVQAVLERARARRKCVCGPARRFLPASDERVAGTIEAIENDPMRDGSRCAIRMTVQRPSTGLTEVKGRSSRARSGSPTVSILSGASLRADCLSDCSELL